MSYDPKAHSKAAIAKLLLEHIADPKLTSLRFRAGDKTNVRIFADVGLERLDEAPATLPSLAEIALTAAYDLGFSVVHHLLSPSGDYVEPQRKRVLEMSDLIRESGEPEIADELVELVQRSKKDARLSWEIERDTFDAIIDPIEVVKRLEITEGN